MLMTVNNYSRVSRTPSGINNKVFIDTYEASELILRR